MAKCPKCSKDIECLNFDITGTCSSQLYKEDVLKGEGCDYDLSCLTDTVEYDNFACPVCDEVLFFTQEEAENFFKNDNRNTNQTRKLYL